jgi:Type II secretion system (T2SS), protein E, N-terminal domain
VGLSDEALALAFRTGLPYVGLRDHEHDPELDHVVPLDAARFARVLPLTAADDHVRLAVADPEPDLAVLTPYLEGRRVELAIAPVDELEEILGPPPDEVEVPVAEPEAAEPEPLAPPEPEPPEAAAATTDGIEEEVPAAEPLAAAEPEPLAEPEPEPPAPAEPEPPVVEHYAFAPAEAPGEAPSWLAPPPKRRWLRAIGRFLLYVLVLAAVCGAVAAYLLTR